jgi:ABC-type transport system involved in multi-copper enzyme maturation permease subunit
MTTPTITPYRSDLHAGRDGFTQLVRAEWIKFRTVRGWVIGLFIAAVIMDLVGLFAFQSSSQCNFGPGTPTRSGRACLPYIPLGPGGEAVTDSFYFVHQPLTGNGTITVRVTSLTGLHFNNSAVRVGQGSASQGPPMAKGAVPWAKAGIIIKESTKQGSAYAAMVVTASHGVRMQYDYTGDIAGWAGAVTAASPRWLRLTRSGDTLTGQESVDGSHWTEVGAVPLAGLKATVQAGLLVTSPEYSALSSFGSGVSGGPSQATAVFDHVSLRGTSPSRGWVGGQLGGGSGPGTSSSGFHQAGGVFTVNGSGDIAPLIAGAGAALNVATIGDHLAGAFAGLIAVVVIAAMFITAEFRRGLIRTTFTASPRRGRVLAAKAVVIGSVTFVLGLAAAAIAVIVGTRLSNDQGQYVLAVSGLTELRVIVGTAALLAVAAVLALAIGTMVRRSAAAITAVIAAIVLPYILAVASVLPLTPSDWVLRLTPAAGFAVQQSAPQYAQVIGPYLPRDGYFPLAPWAGFAVLCAYAAVAMGLAIFLVRRRDA